MARLVKVFLSRHVSFTMELDHTPTMFGGFKRSLPSFAGRYAAT